MPKPDTIEDALERATAAFRAGRFAEAERLAGKVLAA
jgi:hypothetical protein